METKPKAARKSTLKAVPKPAAKKPDIPESTVARLTRWNEKYPNAKCSWVVIADDTPANQKTCRICEKAFRNGRVTRVDSKGAYCGPKCHRTTFAK